MGIDARGIVSIVELIVYVPAMVLATFLCVKHGFGRTSGWVYTLLLCLIRVVGSICQLVTYSNPSVGLIQAVIILDSIGLSPLLLATLGMLSRLVDWINAGKQRATFGVHHFRLLMVLIIVGLILAIVGGTSTNPGPDGTIEVPTVSKVGIILYIVAFVGLCVVLLVSCLSVSYAPKTERLIALAVGLAMPFIAVRLVYSALSVFIHDKTFSRLGGSVGVLVGMSIVEEFVVVAIYLLLGLKLEKLLPSQRGEISSRQSGGKLLGGRLRQGRQGRHGRQGRQGLGYTMDNRDQNGQHV